MEHRFQTAYFWLHRPQSSPTALKAFHIRSINKERSEKWKKKYRKSKKEQLKRVKNEQIAKKDKKKIKGMKSQTNEQKTKIGTKWGKKSKH